MVVAGAKAVNAVAKLESAIISRVPAEEYFSIPGTSITRLKELKRSALHYQYRLSHPKESGAMRLGTASHTAVLEPDRFRLDYAVWERRTAGGKLAPRNGQWWEAFQAENKNKTIISDNEAATALTIAAAVRSDPAAMKYLAEGEPEVSMRWQMLGRPCKGRVDWITRVDGRPVVVGLKTARDCREIFFGNAAAKLGYGMQWAWYWAGFKIITGEIPLMKEIVVESDLPHALIVYNVPEEVILRGEEEYLELVNTLERHEQSNEWMGPSGGREIDVSMPTWWYGENTGDDLGDLGLELEQEE
jgi:hypothetical protein